MTSSIAPPLPAPAEIAADLAARGPGGDVIVALASEAEARALAEALAVGAPALRIVLLPETDALPGAEVPASPANVGARNAALALLAEATPDAGTVLVTTADAMAQAWPAPGDGLAPALTLAVGADTDLTALHERLLAMAYRDDDRVDEAGEVALRGQVLDVFPVQAEAPVRIAIEDGRIAGIAAYDLLDQRSTAALDAIVIVAATEPAPTTPRVPLTAHLPEASLLLDPAVDSRRNALRMLANEIGAASPHAPTRLLSEADWRGGIDGRTRIAPEPAAAPPPRFVETRTPERGFVRSVRAARAAGDRVVLLGRARDLRFLTRRAARLLDAEIAAAEDWAGVLTAAAGSILSLAMPCERGFARPGILAIAAADLLGSRADRGDAGGSRLAGLPDMGTIRIGDVVVHEDHGIGVVDGLETLPGIAGTPATDAIRLRYAGDATRLVPTDQAHRLWRYGAEPEAVTLDRLDGDGWRKRRAKVSATVDAAAAALLDLAAERASAKAPVLEADPAAFERFCAGFPFPATADQVRAFAAVADDLASGKPMERLVIGDVGFGKTEIALRAAAIAVLAGRQVAVAAPTTVLARQHAELFAARFAPLGIAVAALTRLSSAADRKRVRAGLADGSIRIVVGTAAVAGKGAGYADLGLAIIDEEQRFGAADKARLRALGASHGLTMTATPIPRTLQSALIGLQAMSVLATPPARRQPIRTTLAEYDPALVRSAILREKSHGGQSFVVVPRIGDMAAVAAELARVVPDLSVVQAHGKLPAADIDAAMVRFAAGEGDILLATNIIEAGLDVPRANTMIVTGADAFGLSQLHQLRGRVGRGARRGHLLMLTEARKALPPATERRLRTLEVLNRLGAGFEISARDLDLRGAGDLMGEDQTGHMTLIGVDLYQQMLAVALQAARGVATDRALPDMQFGLPARLPERWIADPDTRLEIYMRLVRMDRAEAVDLIEAELEDRFGAIPDEATNLLALARLRAAARAAGLARIVAGPRGITLHPRPEARFAVPGVALVEAGDGLTLAEAIEDAQDRLARAAALLEAAVAEDA